MLQAARAALDGYSRVTNTGRPICFGDLDGVLVIPRQAEEEAIQNGMSTVDAFRNFGVM